MCLIYVKENVDIITLDFGEFQAEFVYELAGIMLLKVNVVVITVNCSLSTDTKELVFKL